MGTDENAELIRRGYAAFNAGDMETLMRLFRANATWHTPGLSPIARRPRGARSGLCPVRPVRGGHRRDLQGLAEGALLAGHAWDEFWS